MKKFISILLVISVMVQIWLCATFNVASALVRPVMDSDNAAMFIGFLTNNGKMTESEIKSSDKYKILTNTYSGDNEDAEILALKLFIEMNTAQMANQASINKDFYTGEIISYLEKHVPSSESIGLSEEVINEYKNHYANILVDAIKDIVDSFFSEATSCFQVSDLYDLYGYATGTVNKAKKIVDYTMASIEGICLIYENEYAGRYGYFQSYLNNRSGYDSPNDETFQMIMEYNRLAYSDSNWLSGFLDVFSFITHKDSFTNHFDVMDEWAEFTYQLGVYIDEKNNGSSTGGASESNEFEVSSISFAASNFSLFMNYSLTNPAVAYPINATNRSITYSSGNSSIATVDSSGKITPVNPGIVNIYASTLNGTTSSCTITVLPFTATEINNGYKITQFIGTQSQIVIPDKAQGKSIISIGDKTFYGCINLTSVTIPNSVTSIGNSAFSGCTSLKNVTIPDSITSIGNWAFYNCKSLMSVSIPDSVTSIGDYAFYNCTSLESVALPDSITSIGCASFRGCTSLTSVTIPDSVTSVGEWAFDGCYNLNAVYITDLGKWCGISFYGNIPSNPVNYAHNLYINGVLATDITIPDSVTSISDGAFYNCQSLMSVSIPDSVTSIGDYAFGSCFRLKDITLPDSVTSIGDYAFYHCPFLTSITIPDSVTSIGYSAFRYCSSLTNVTIPSSVTSIGDRAFGECLKLISIEVSDANTYYTSIDGVLFNKDGTELLCYPRGGKTVYIIPDGITSIGNYAFFNCMNLVSVIMPDSVTSIGEWAFYNCEITSIVIPYSVTSIGKDAFAGCTSLVSVTISDSVTSIDNAAFYSCTSLKTVTFIGTEEEWSAIYIGDSNDCLNNADIIFAPKSDIAGDVSGDEKVDSADLLIMQNIMLGNAEFNGYADFDGNGVFDSRDLVLLQLYILEF